MKGSLWKRAAGIGLVLALSAGLCACGKKNENASLAKEGVYSVKEFKLPEMDYDYYDVRTSAYRNGRVYLLINVENWRDEYWSGTILLSMKDDGTDVQTSVFEEPDFVHGSGEIIMPGTVPEGTNEPDAAQDPEDGTQPEGTPADLEATPEVEDPEEEESGEDIIGDEDYIYPPFEGDIPYEGDNTYTWENNYYDNYSFGSDGRLYAVRAYNYQYEDYENPENNVYTQKNFLDCWDADGSFLRDTEMEGFRSEGEWYYIESMSVSEDGTVNLLMDGDSVCMVTVDPQGNCSGKEPLPEEAEELLKNNSFSAYPKDDGTFLLMYYVYSENYDSAKVYLSSYNPATHVMEELGEVPSSVSMNGYGMRPGRSSDFVYRTILGIYTYNVGDEDSQMKMSFINSDLNVSNVYAVIELDEESFICIYNENYEDGMLAGIFTHVNPEDIPDKSVLVLAGNGIGSDLKRRVVEFNRSSEEYRIVVKDYSMYASYDDYTAGITQLNNDIISGKMPDIMIASDNLPTEVYASKGWLADIGKLIKEDEELSQVEFLENVFNAYSMNGKLIYVVPRFNIVTMIGKKSIVGDGASWTMEDAMKRIEDMPEGTTLLGADTTRSEFFDTMMRFCGSDFIDLAAGKCYFDSQNFIKMMEYARSLPEEFEYDDEFWMNWDYYSQYRDNKVLLMNLYISSFESISRNVNGIFGGDVSYIGFPTESGKGSYLSAYERYAISSKSDYIDGAWEFLRYYLTDEYQSAIDWNLPVQKAHFLELAQKATQRPYYIDEETGEKVEYDNTMWIGGDEPVVVDPLSQEQLDELLTFLYTVDTPYSTNDEIMKIVSEEIEAYFSGQKSAKEVADIIQNRAQLYIDVNR